MEGRNKRDISLALEALGSGVEEVEVWGDSIFTVEAEEKEIVWIARTAHVKVDVVEVLDNPTDELLGVVHKSLNPAWV